MFRPQNILNVSAISSKYFVFLLQAAILFRRRPFLGAKPEVEIETPDIIPDEETVEQQRIKIKIPNQVNFSNKF